MTERNTQWHPAFCSAIKLELKENKNDLNYTSEYNVNTKPVQIDLLVIKKSPDVCIQNEIGKIFRGHNIMEYKSPKDSLNEDVFIKVIGYACLYKANEAHVDEIRLDDITLSFVREGYPKKLMQWLHDNDFEVKEDTPGIYHITKEGIFPAQIIIGDKINKETHTWLTSLTSNMDEESAKRLVINIGALSEKDDKDNADSVFQVSATENAMVFNNMKEGDDAMCEALRKLMQPEIEQELKKCRTESQIELLVSLVKDGAITLEIAAEKAEMDLEEFKKVVNE